MLAAEERLIVPQDAPGCETNWFVFVAQLVEPWGVQQRDRILQEMERQGIQVSNYFPPVHLQPFIAAQYGHAPGDFPSAESVSRRTIALPFYNRLTQDEVAIVCGVLARCSMPFCAEPIPHKSADFHTERGISTGAAFAFSPFCRRL
jgi:perosamine synthetase